VEYKEYAKTQKRRKKHLKRGKEEEQAFQTGK